MKNSNLTNLLSNYGSKTWSLISVFIFIPIYIKILGLESYAVIAFYTLLLGIISFADSGMSSAVIKEFSLDRKASYKYSVLRRIENLYILICIVIAVLIAAFSSVISNRWLKSDFISQENLSYYIVLIGIGASIQLLSSLYFGAMFGLNKQVKANTYQIIWNVFKTFGVIILLMFYKSTLEIYFLWQILCNIVYILILRFSVVDVLKLEEFELSNYLKAIPKDILKYIGGMTIITIISSINSQSDKIITSSFFSLEEFGYYNIASMISQFPVILAVPVALFVFPLFSKFSGMENAVNLKIVFNKISFLLHVIVFPVSIVLFLYSKEIIKLWINDSISYNELPIIVSLVKFLIIGSLFLAIQFPLYYLLLSKGKTKYNIYQGIVQIVIGLPLLYICAAFLGLRFMGIPWILINLGGLIFLTIIVFKKYLNIKYTSFFIRIILVPFLVSIFICGIMYFLYRWASCYFLFFAINSGVLSILGAIAFNNYSNKKKINDISELYNFPN